MKLNLKKLCLLLILFIATLATMPKVFAANDEPVKQSRVAKRRYLYSPLWKDIAMVDYAQFYSADDWRNFAKAFGNVSSPGAYYRRYKQQLDPERKNRKEVPMFRLQEDEILKILVEESTKDTTWVNISFRIPGYRAEQCKDRWFYLYFLGVVNKPHAYNNFAKRIFNEICIMAKNNQLPIEHRDLTPPIQDDSPDIVNYDLEYYDYFDSSADD